MAENERPRIVRVSAAHVLSEWRGHVLGIWSGAPDIEAARALAITVERLALQRPGRTAYLGQIRSLSAVPEEPIRRILIELGRRVNLTLNCAGIVIDGQGFHAATVRAFVTGLGLAAGSRFPMRGFSTLAALVAWARPRLIAAQCDPGTEQEIQAAFAHLAAQLEAP